MSLLADILLFIFGASLLYGVLFSRERGPAPAPRCPLTGDGSPTTDRPRSGRVRDFPRSRGTGSSAGCHGLSRRCSPSPFELIAEGFAAQGGKRTWK